MTELNTALYARLTADSQLMAAAPGGVHRNVAVPVTPGQEVEWPFVVFHDSSPAADRYTFGQRYSTHHAVRFTVYSRDGVKAAAAILSRIDELLTDQHAAIDVDGHDVTYCRRRDTGDFTDIVGGEAEHRAWGTWEIWVSPAV